MKIEDHIKRLLSDPDGLDFDGLRRKGIALLQDLSSQQWTDYNLHDPGVTLLELLSYGLTDLVYRTDFDVADFLTGPDGRIDFEAQALYPPPDIFPNQPVTDIDFCKLIYDQLPPVDDVWIRKRGKTGLYSVFIKPHESLFESDSRSDCEALRKDVLLLLSMYRNLCRDVERVSIVRAQVYSLSGEIEIDDSRPAAEVYADIYFSCAKLISSGGQIVRFEEALAQGMSWEQMLEGPLTYHGYIADGHFKQANYEIDVVNLITLVRHIPGVRQVKRLCLRRDAEDMEYSQVKLKESGEVCPVLGFPQSAAVLQKLRLIHGKSTDPLQTGSQEDFQHVPGRYADQLHEEAKLYLRKLEFEYDAFRNNEGQLQRLLKLPQGSYRDLAEYGSVGEHTPAVYGINHYGVPDSYPPEAKARARQLKAYLYPFEQMMANYLASLQGIKRLYSSDETLDRTYFAQYLGNEQVPNLEVLYSGHVGQGEVDAVLAGQDTFTDRRNRVLDSLLAVYGEVFPADALRRYDVYHPDDFGHHLIECKIGLLKDFCDLSAGRGQAMNLLLPYWTGENCAPIQRRVQLLSGCSGQVVGRKLVQALNNDEVKFISDKRYEGQLERQVDYGKTKPLAWAAEAAPQPVLSGLPFGTLSPSLLSAGIRKENYSVLAEEGEQSWLCLSLDEKRCWPLLRLPSADAPQAARELRQRLIGLNKATEGFHLLEHVLLRPRVAATQHDVKSDFYAHRVSVVLPGFTARFRDQGCRAWVEELIAQNLPAHILPTFYWLDFAFLAQFELRYARWLELVGVVNDPAALDQAAAELIAFFNTVDAYHTNRQWM
ncbi:hypothetical protein GTP45_09790 [Pseudoduganella sp. FT55W]|uniref:Uncharacterized protein n=1 Tax=Duganella rivi TaxID=2666083 RepID=A0A7X4KBG3_9BURK|nr:hypothetical protein [Duganella rivi]MYM67120.1 hypothetical protein [Duganella rivi]